MRQKSLNVLEFDKIKTLVEKETMSDLGERKLLKWNQQLIFKQSNFK